MPPATLPSDTSRRPRAWRAALAAVFTTAVVASTLIALPASAATTVVVDDTFDRTSSTGWGAAPTGGDYNGTFPSGSMSSGSGAAALSLGPGKSASVLIGSAAATDARSDIAVRLDAQSGAAYYATLLRYQGNGAHYRARLEINTSGVPFLAVSRVAGGTEKSLGSVKLPAAMDKSQWYDLAFSVTGTSPVAIQATLSKSGTTPGTPQLNVTDSDSSRIQSGGRVGFWGYINGGTSTTKISLDRFTVRNGAVPLSQGAPAAAPSPTPTPTTAPAEPAPAGDSEAVSSGSRGSVAVGSAAYSVPSGAIYVKNSSTSSTQNGGASTPFKSVQKAVDTAGPGATIVVRGGTYNESVTVPSGKNLTIQAYPNEAVWFDGSTPVSNWSASGSTWVASNWTAQFPSDMDGAASRFVNSAYPMAASPDQVFVDGVAQRQVRSASEVQAGTFAVDYGNKRLILGTNPSGKSVRASNLTQAFNVLAQNTTLQGFGVRRYATTYGASAAVRFQNTGAVARDLTITDNALVGLSINNNDSRAERVTVRKNGMLGIGGNAAYRLVIKDSVVSQNNVEKFKDAPVAGGIKITRSRDVTIHNVDASGNTGSGIWMDESCYDVKITKSSANDNTTTGIQLEISAKALLAGNQALRGGTGIIVMNTSDVQIFNNDFGGSSFNSISLKQDARRLSTASTGWDPRMGKGDSTMSWVTKNITISNNVFGTTGQNLHPRPRWQHEPRGRYVEPRHHGEPLQQQGCGRADHGAVGQGRQQVLRDLQHPVCSGLGEEHELEERDDQLGEEPL